MQHEGGNSLLTLTQVLVPACAPALIAVALLCIVETWNDFINPLIYLLSPQGYTLAQGLALLYKEAGMNQPQIILAVAFVAILPLLAIFFFGQRFLVFGYSGEAQSIREF